MDNSAGTIIYLLITFLILIASLLKKRNKAKLNVPSPNNAGTENTNKKTGLEGLLDTMFEAPSPDYQEEEVLFDDFEEAEPDLQERQEDPVPEIFKEGVSVFAHDDPTTEKIETGLLDNLATKDQVSESVNTKKEPDDLNNLLDDFEIKHAIVYSEILKPKYF